MDTKYVDVHAHLDLGEYDSDVKEMLDDCARKGVVAVIANGVTPKSNRNVLEIASKFKIVKPALGYYPDHVVEDGLEKVEEEIKFILKQKDAVAFGEVGLDYKWHEHEKEIERKTKLQKAAFLKFVEASEKAKKPLIIHSRKAELDIIEMLESSSLKNPVFHCFCGKKKLMQRIADNGWSFSVPVTVIRLQQFQEMVKYANISQLLTETDSPYLAPVQGERNTPANVSLAIKKIAELKGFDETETANSIFMNYQKLFSR